MTTSFVARGTELIKEAVQKDNEEDFETALHLYSRGIEFLMTGLKYEKNKRVNEAIREKVKKYLQRAESIQEFVQSKAYQKSKNRKKIQKIGQKHKGGEGDNDSDSDSDIDEETKKLKGAISQAIVIEKPNVRWSDVAGLDIAKQLLKEAVILPIRFPHIFVGKRKPWEGILLYGPPGTGKSYLAKAVATEANNSTFFSVSSSDLVSKYVGESERLVKNLFELARERRPSIIFIDEIDSLATARNDSEHDSARRLKTEFMVQLQGVGKNVRGVLTLGATNCPWDLDPAIRRRFAKRIYIPLPDKVARKVMFKVHIGDTPNSLTDNDLTILAEKTPGFSGSDIAGIVQDALMEPVRTMIAASHFKKVKAKNLKKRNNRIQNINNIDHKNNDENNINNINNNENNENKEEKKNNNEQKMIDNNNDNNNEDENDEDNWYWMPCSPNDPNGIKMGLMKIPSNEQSRVRAEELKIGHFLRILQSAKPSVGEEDIKKHQEWTTKYGQEGT